MQKYEDEIPQPDHSGCGISCIGCAFLKEVKNHKEKVK